MEKLAHERDRYYWACSAQNPKLLPKPESNKKSAGAKIKASVSGIFEMFDKGKEDK